MSHVLNEWQGNDWTLYNGDCVQVIEGLPDESVDMCIHSPPFSNLYIYSDSEADMGNAVDDAEFIKHYEFLIAQLFRVMVTGRLCVVHYKDLPKYANRDDTAGLKDFPGQIIAAYERAGWSYHSRVTIWKCPVVERERTNNNGLLHKTVLRDRSQLRQGMADYLIVLRKPPVESLMSSKPVTDPHGLTEYVGLEEYDPRKTDKHPSPYARGRGNSERDHAESIHIWRRYAEPVWWDIDQMDVLNYKTARDDKDERHICPLQLPLIHRAIQLWTNPGDVVLSPFAGIGSEGVGALRAGRKFVGIELKPGYCADAVKHLRKAERHNHVRSLF